MDVMLTVTCVSDVTRASRAYCRRDADGLPVTADCDVCDCDVCDCDVVCAGRARCGRVTVGLAVTADCDIV